MDAARQRQGFTGVIANKGPSARGSVRSRDLPATHMKEGGSRPPRAPDRGSSEAGRNGVRAAVLRRYGAAWRQIPDGEQGGATLSGRTPFRRSSRPSSPPECASRHGRPAAHPPGARCRRRGCADTRRSSGRVRKDDGRKRLVREPRRGARLGDARCRRQRSGPAVAVRRDGGRPGAARARAGRAAGAQRAGQPDRERGRRAHERDRDAREPADDRARRPARCHRRANAWRRSTTLSRTGRPMPV